MEQLMDHKLKIKTMMMISTKCWIYLLHAVPKIQWTVKYGTIFDLIISLC